MKLSTAIAALLLFTACATAPEDGDDDMRPVAAVTPPPATDPRVAELQVVVAELLDRIEVMNARIQKLESGAPPRAAVVTAAARPAQNEPTVAETAEPPAPAVRPARTTRRAAPPAGGTVADQYRAGLELFGKGSIDQARTTFQQVFDADADGELADNALYWIGETYYVTGKYADALKLYRRVVDEYSDQNKAPDAMLKIGLAYSKLGDLALARRTFQELVGKYPYSTSAAAAKYEMKRIQY